MNRDSAQPCAAQTPGVAKARPNFEQLFQAMPGQYMILDRELVYVEANPAYCASTERTREDIVGRYVFEAFPPTGEGGGRSRNRCAGCWRLGSPRPCPWRPIPSPCPTGASG